MAIGRDDDGSYGGAMATNRERMLAGEWYRVADDAELAAMVERRQQLCSVINAIDASDELVAATLSSLLGSIGPGSVIRPPFRCDYGSHISLGDGVFVNFGAVFLDCGLVTIGDATQVGPNVQLLTPDHPRRRAATGGLGGGPPDHHRRQRLDRRGSHRGPGRDNR